MKEKFIKSTLILVIGGLITKILGMIIKIITTRIIGLEGIGLYTMVMPSFNLFITIATLSLPLSLSKIVSENTRNNKKVIFGSVPIALFFNLLIIIFIFLIAKPFATFFLKNENLTIPIMSIGLTLPFITISGIAKGYFFGKQRMLPHVISNIVEQIVRISIIVVFLPKILKYNVIYSVTVLILINIISELSSIIILLLFLPQKFTIKREYFRFEYDNFRNIASISIPNTLSRIVSSTGIFLEPIILTFILTFIGHSNSYITNEYGIISGYVIPIVSLPSFLSGAISSALLPVLTKYNVLKNKVKLKNKLIQAITVSLIIGVPFTILLFLFPKECLNLVFKETLGANYLKVASLIFLITYIQAPIISCLQAINKSKTIMKTTTISIIIKTVVLIGLTFLDIGMYSLLIATLFSSIYTIVEHIIVIKKYLNT